MKVENMKTKGLLNLYLNLYLNYWPENKAASVTKKLQY